MGRRIVLLYGRSMLLSLLAASLENSPGLCVSRAVAWPAASRLLAARLPDALIFDLSATSESHILPLLFRNPGLLLIGLDTESNQAMLVSGKEVHSLTLSRIHELVAGTNEER
jgi:hypothetical protein